MPGSRLLLLAHVRFDSGTASDRPRGGHQRQKSDDLIDDLELQLGTTATDYLQVRLTYCHSGFPGHDNNMSIGSMAPRKN